MARKYNLENEQYGNCFWKTQWGSNEETDRSIYKQVFSIIDRISQIKCNNYSQIDFDDLTEYILWPNRELLEHADRAVKVRRWTLFATVKHCQHSARLTKPKTDGVTDTVLHNDTFQELCMIHCFGLGRYRPCCPHN